DNKVVHFIHRYDIEGNSMEAIMENLISAFVQFCE
ncbi:MAG TPA: BrxA/BrxB family bacilliredoxin, partial [Niallia sp.]|nr:BrxA/BrxB family bacilliredoxin [Niallia sp.]